MKTLVIIKIILILKKLKQFLILKEILPKQNYKIVFTLYKKDKTSLVAILYVKVFLFLEPIQAFFHTIVQSIELF